MREYYSEMWVCRQCHHFWIRGVTGPVICSRCYENGARWPVYGKRVGSIFFSKDDAEQGLLLIGMEE